MTNTAEFDSYNSNLIECLTTISEVLSRLNNIIVSEDNIIEIKKKITDALAPIHLLDDEDPIIKETKNELFKIAGGVENKLSDYTGKKVNLVVDPIIDYIDKTVEKLEK